MNPSHLPLAMESSQQISKKAHGAALCCIGFGLILVVFIVFVVLGVVIFLLGLFQVLLEL